MPIRNWLCQAISLSICVLLGACAESPRRPYVSASAPTQCNIHNAGKPGETTPETGNNYIVHFIEFDDQGWPYPEQASSNSSESASSQMDCAIASLAEQVEKGEVLALVYVHGWKHSADADDKDVKRFIKLVRHQAAQERARKVIGFYIGWNGGTVSLPIAKEFTFWSRKNAAHHVSLGSVRGFFSRVKALRNHYNRPAEETSKNCGNEWRGESQTCRLRTVMIGHSFGAQILYESVAPYLLETLTGARDVPTMRIPVTARQRGIADLVILLNPAFEATRYEPIHRAAMHYNPKWFEPPLLVSLTSLADYATRFAFPIARTINSTFQYPTTSLLESESIRKTHGHVDSFLTHRLEKTDGIPSVEKPERDTACFDERSPANDMREKFAKASLSESALNPGWTRSFCGNLLLRHLDASSLPAKSIVWNVQTDKLIIRNHNAIATQAVFDFINALYLDLSTTFKPQDTRSAACTLACEDD